MRSCRLEVRGALGAPAQALLAPDGVDGPVVHEREEEGPERATGRIERFRCPPDSEECLLYDLLRDQLLGRHPQRDAVRRSTETPVELVEGQAVSARQAPMQLEIREILLTHPAFLPHGRDRPPRR